MMGLRAVPATTSPVTSRVVNELLREPSSSWFGIVWMELMVSVAVTL